MLVVDQERVVNKIVRKRAGINLNFLRNLLVLSVISFLCIMVYSHSKMTEIEDPVLQKKLVDELVFYHSITTGFMGFILFVFSQRGEK